MGFPVSTSTPKAPWYLGLTSNATNAGSGSNNFPAPTTTAPTTSTTAGQGVVIIDNLMEYVDIVFFGTDAANEAFEARLVGWSSVSDPAQPDSSAASTLWVPHSIGRVTVTLGLLTGVSGAYVDNTNFFCDTITTNSSAPSVGGPDRFFAYTPTNDEIGVVTIAGMGCQKLGIYIKVNSTALSGNCLWRSR